MLFVATSCAFNKHKRTRSSLFHAITSERGTFMKIRYFKNKASVALNLLVSLFYLLVAPGGRKRGNRQTDGRTQTKYCNPRCACAPRVNEGLHMHRIKREVSHYTETDSAVYIPIQ